MDGKLTILCRFCRKLEATSTLGRFHSRLLQAGSHNTLSGNTPNYHGLEADFTVLLGARGEARPHIVTNSEVSNQADAARQLTMLL